MTRLFEPDVVPTRSRADVAVTIICVVVVAAGLLFPWRAGACGTGHYVLFQLLGGMIVSVVEDLWQSRYDADVARVLAYLLDVAVFGAVVFVWHRRASESRYTLGVIAMTAVYLCSYFFLLPTVDCP